MGSKYVYLGHYTSNPHVIITTPFVVRIMLPAMRSLEPEYHEQALLLGLSPAKAWWHGQLALLRTTGCVCGADYGILTRRIWSIVDSG